MTLKVTSVALVHPQLIIGGAERLVLDLALALKSQSYKVKVFTTSLDPSRAFREAVDGTVEVETVGNRIPNLLFNRFQLLIGILKMFILTLFMLLFRPRYDIYIVDTNPFVLPLFKLFRRRVIFYCHFPDKLLAPGGSKLFRLYRKVMGLIEEVCFLFADQVWVNSGFTKTMYDQSFRLSRGRRPEVSVVYPCVNFDNLSNKGGNQVDSGFGLPDTFFFSLNRIERKKKIELAIHALAEMRRQVSDGAPEAKLVIAGGYLADHDESRMYMRYLEEEIARLGLKEHVLIFTNVSSAIRLSLLQSCLAVLYTPPNEHFGIVPVEAMYLEKPVICQNNGGPVESVGNDCGYLLPEDPKIWGEKMASLLRGKDLREAMGKNAKRNAVDRFSFESFAKIVDSKIKQIN
jgi:alpha-1,3/alpha-1,6-mannosyltransferase